MTSVGNVKVVEREGCTYDTMVHCRYDLEMLFGPFALTLLIMRQVITRVCLGSFGLVAAEPKKIRTNIQRIHYKKRYNTFDLSN